MTLQKSGKAFKNTFAPHIGNKELTVHAVIAGLKFMMNKHKDLPREVQDAVTEEFKRQHPQS